MCQLHNPRWLSALLAALTVVAATGAQAAPGDAQDPQPPTQNPRYMADSLSVQPGKATFKLQAKVSQAKLPVERAEFQQVVVNVLKGSASSQPVCTESLGPITVLNGVLNLEIGENMNCALAEVMATSPDLRIQVCLSDANCLPPLKMSHVPLAVKSTYAYQAQQAYVSQRSAEADMAHYITADLDTRDPQQLGRGYYDLHTPADVDRINDLLSSAGFNAQSVISQHDGAGYIRWTPLNGRGDNRLHILGGDPEDGSLRSLAMLVLHAQTTDVRGDLVGHGSASFIPDAETVLDVVPGMIRLRAGTDDYSPDEGLASRGIEISTSATINAYGAQMKLQSYLDTEISVGEGESEIVVQDGEVSFRGSTVSFDNVENITGLDDKVRFTMPEIRGGKDPSDAAARAGQIVDGTVSSSDLADRAVTAGKISTDAVNTSQISIEPSGRLAIANGAITLSKMAGNSVGEWQLRSDSVGAPELKDDAVGAEHLKDDSVGAEHLKDDSVGAEHLKPGSVGSLELKSQSVGGSTSVPGQIKLRSITAAELAPNAVQSSIIQNGAVTSVDLAARAVTNDKLGITRYSHNFNAPNYKTEEHELSTRYTYCALTYTLVNREGGRCQVYTGSNGKWRVQARSATCRVSCF